MPVSTDGRGSVASPAAIRPIEAPLSTPTRCASRLRSIACARSPTDLDPSLTGQVSGSEVVGAPCPCCGDSAMSARCTPHSLDCIAICSAEARMDASASLRELRPSGTGCGQRAAASSLGFLIALVIWGWFDVRKRGRSIPTITTAHKTDFTVYTEAGAAFFDGRDPYDVTNPRGWGYLYPPLFAILVAPLHALAPAESGLHLVSHLRWPLAGAAILELRPHRPRRAAGDRPRGTVRPHSHLARRGRRRRRPPFPRSTACSADRSASPSCICCCWAFGCSSRIARLWQPFWGGCLLALAITLKITPLVPACVVAAGQLLGRLARTGNPLASASAAATSAGLVCGLVVWLLLVPAICARMAMRISLTWEPGGDVVASAPKAPAKTTLPATRPRCATKA